MEYFSPMVHIICYTFGKVCKKLFVFTIIILFLSIFTIEF